MKKWLYYLVLPLGLLFVASKISRSNSAYIRHEPNVKQNDGDIISLRKVNDMVQKSFLNREYYEAMTYSGWGPGWWANYNKERQVLIISGEPMSGWWGIYHATPDELKLVADKGVRWQELSNHLKPYREPVRKQLPTRINDVISIF